MNEKDVFNAVGELPPDVITEASRPKRRARLWTAAAAACLMLAIGAAAFAGVKTRAAELPAAPVFYAVDGKLYKQAAKTTTLAARFFTSSCTGQTAHHNAEPTPAVTEPSQTDDALTPSPTDGDLTLSPTENGSVVIRRDEKSEGVYLVVTTHSPGGSAFPGKQPMSFIVVDIYSGDIPSPGIISISIPSYGSEPGEELDPADFGELADSVGFSRGGVLFRTGSKPIASGEDVNALFDELCKSESMSWSEVSELCREKLMLTGEGSVLGEIPTVAVSFSDGSGVSLSMDFCPEAGIFVSGETCWFRMTDRAVSLLNGLTG